MMLDINSLAIGIWLGALLTTAVLWLVELFQKKHQKLSNVKSLLKDAASDTYKSYDKLTRIYRIINLAERRGLEK